MFNKLNLYLHLRVSWSLRTRDGEFDLAEIFLNVKCMKTVRVSPRPRRCCRTDSQVLLPFSLGCFITPLVVNSIIECFAERFTEKRTIIVTFRTRISLSEQIGMQQYLTFWNNLHINLEQPSVRCQGGGSKCVRTIINGIELLERERCWSTFPHSR